MNNMDYIYTTDEIALIVSKLRSGEPLTPEEARNTALSLEFYFQDYMDTVYKLHDAVRRLNLPYEPGSKVDDNLIAYVEHQQRVIEAAKALRDADVYKARVRTMVAMEEYEALVEALSDANPRVPGR